MAEYIDRDMFLKIISHKPSSPTTDREDRLINGFVSAVKNCPAADVRPVRVGKLEKHGAAIRCSVCGFDTQSWDVNFCPNCGAMMEES